MILGCIGCLSYVLLSLTARGARGATRENWRQRLGSGGERSAWLQHGSLWPWFGHGGQKDTDELVPLGERAYRERCAVYTYVDLASMSKGKDDAHRLIAVWKRAWIAAGFRPEILGRAHAQQHALYEKLTGRVLQPSFIHPWMALSSVGGGIYAELEVIPFYTKDNEDASMNYLRQCSFAQLGFFSNVKNGVFFGSGQDCEDVVTFLTMSRTRGLRDALVPGALATIYPARFKVRRTRSLAHYTEEVEDLPTLMSTHLHEHFLRSHSALLVLDPLDKGALSLSIMELATSLSQCPTSSSSYPCPPHLEDCSPCQPLDVSVVQSLEQATDSPNSFCFVSVPHPLTYLALRHRSFKFMEAPFLIRETTRDGYLRAIGASVAPKWAGAMQIAQIFTAYIKQSSTWASSAWVTWEEDEADFDLIVSLVGFSFPRQSTSMSPFTSYDETVDLLAAARKALLEHKKREMIESWNMDSTEFWHYVRSFQLTIANV